MSSILSAIVECLTGMPQPTYSVLITEKVSVPPNEKSNRSDQDIANELLALLFNASKNDPNLEFKLQSAVNAYGWWEGLAERVLNGLQNAFEKSAPMGDAIQAAFQRSVQEGSDFAEGHPIYFAVIALGVLVLMAPWALEALGFAELGPIEGSFAALWQSRYAAYVPKGSLFSFFQRLGMVWK